MPLGLFLFLAGAILLIVAFLPLFKETLSPRRQPSRVEDRNEDDVKEEEQGRSKLIESTPFLFGIGGVILVALSLIVGQLAR